MTGAAGGKAYLYRMDIPMRFAGKRIPASHGIDLSLTFNVWDDPAHSVPDFTDHPGAAALGRRWVRMLGHFARTGEPGDTLGEWPVYEAGRRASLRMDGAGFQLEHDLDGQFRREVW
jgi:carboxylesterase type B